MLRLDAVISDFFIRVVRSFSQAENCGLGSSPIIQLCALLYADFENLDLGFDRAVFVITVFSVEGWAISRFEVYSLLLHVGDGW